MNEINESNNQSTIVKIEPNYSDGEKVENSAQIKREPIDIKDELSESDDEEMDDDGTSDKSTVHDPKDVETIQNKCYICDIRLESRNDFDEHLESHRNMLPYNCSQCSTYTHPIILSSLTALNKHFKRHDYDYLCPQCPLRYRTFKSLKFHIRYSLENQTQEHHCETCRRVFTNRPAFRKHIAVHRNLTTQRYKCDPCKKCFTSGSSLLRHQRFTNHSNSEEYCGSQKGKSSQFKGPTLRRRDPKGVDRVPNKCYVCDTVLERESDYYVHLESHRSMLPYVCSQCSTKENSFRISTLITLNNHFERHSFNYTCPHCPLQYRTCTSLHHHIRHAHRGQNSQ